MGDVQVEGLDTTLWRAWRVRLTVADMLRDRGYRVAEREQAFEEYMQSFGNASYSELNITAAKESDPEDKIMVFFPSEPKISIRDIRQCAEVMSRESVVRAVVVIKEVLTPYGKKGIEAVNKSGKRIEPFLEVELVVNVTKHDVVPHHVLLSDEEKKAVLTKYNVKENQLPRLLVRDPVARYLGLARGQVIKIERKSATAKEYVTYRLVS